MVTPGTPVFTAMKNIVVVDGIGGLFAGVQARVLMSALFGGVGFATFEACKKKLGVVSPVAISLPLIVKSDSEIGHSDKKVIA